MLMVLGVAPPACWTRMAPPTGAELPSNVLVEIVAVPELYTAPPEFVATFPENEACVAISSAVLQIAPPFLA
jgi:hypothetical protein